MRSAGRFLVIVSLCLAIGFHWWALQSIAWTTMVIEYAKTYSLEEALAKTFDGQHPCSLCHAVQAGKKSEQKNNTQIVTKVDLYCAVAVKVAPRERLQVEYSTETFLPITRADSPPLPPPRLRA
jgi:hypothetical protein